MGARRGECEVSRILMCGPLPLKRRREVAANDGGALQAKKVSGRKTP